MAVVSAPLLSFSASGQIAKTQVYANWKGRPYVRRLVTPADPKSADQVATRTAFAFLSNAWRTSPGDVRAPWAAYAKGQVMTDRNAWIKKNLANLRDGADLNGIILSPGAAGGLAGVPTIAGSAGGINFTMAAPTPLPPGWTVVKMVGAAILDQDPQTEVEYTIHAGTDETTPFNVALSGLAAGVVQAIAWFVYVRSASETDLAYGPGDCVPITVT